MDDTRAAASPLHDTRRWLGRSVLAVGVALTLAATGCGGNGGSGGGVGGVAPPTITSQPASTSVAAGSSASFTVVATGNGLAFQWQRSTNGGAAWGDVAGASAATYATGAVDASMNGHQFRVVIQNPGGTVVSAAVTLTVTVVAAASTTAVSAGASHSLALRSDGSVWAWGSNNDGELGSGSTVASSAAPVPVVLAGGGALSGVSAVSAGFSHSLALRSDGSLLAWGRNQFGQLGDGGTTARNAAAPVRTAAGDPLVGVVHASAGSGVSAAVRSDGSVWVWGWSTSLPAVLLRPTQMLDDAGNPVTGAARVAVGNSYVLVLKSDGSLWTWGSPAGGQSPIRAVPLETAPGAPLTGIVAVSAGWTHALALTSTGQVYSWGGDASAVGRAASLSQARVPALVTDSSGAALVGCAEVHAGLYLSVIRKSDGSVWSFGIQNLGTGGNQTETYPAPVREPGGTAFTGVAAISLRTEHTLALRTSGAVWGWGRNANEQLARTVSSPLDYFVPQPALVLP